MAKDTILIEVAVIPPIPGHEVLLYSVPPALGSKIREGIRVIVPLGRRQVTGIALGTAEPDPTVAVKDVIDVPDDDPLLTPDLLALCRFAARYYMASLGEVLATAVLAGLRTPRATSRTRYEAIYFLSREPLHGEEDQRLSKRAPVQREILTRLAREGTQGLRLEDLGGTAVASSLQTMVRRGWIQVERRESYRPVVEPRASDSPRTLTTAQAEAVERIDEATARRRYETFLLRGVTGSGKTEVYLQAAAKTVAAGRGVVLLVPEIALTEELVSRVVARFGANVALLHSGLSSGERWDEWRRLSRREARLLVGARSAIFAPLPDLGLVIVDEEHDGAYKQEEGFRYNARDLAIVRARNASCPVVLGSATPSIETDWNARSGRFRRIDLPERIERRPLPTVELVDLRAERPEGQPAIFTARLRDGLAENLAAGGQSLIFLNRRGFAHFLQCIACGYAIGCPNCSVTLAFHRHRQILRCHHCDHRIPVPRVCPECDGISLSDVGVGTEQTESALRSFFPSARIARMDRDTMSRKGAHRRLLTAWREEEIDILVGTQMVTKGHDIPGVTLVGVVAADQSLCFPDFRAAERTFQMLTQVAGRAGRGDRPGRVIVQTYRPSHYALELAVTHDFPRFAEKELHVREALGYPPFSRLVNLRLDGIDAGRVERTAQDLGAALRSANEQRPTAERCTILGPAPAPLERLRGRYRWQLLVRARDPRTLRHLVLPTVEAIRRTVRSPAVRIAIDVDPYGML